MNDEVHTISELLGDGISVELCESVHEIAGALSGSYQFKTIDLSYENRQAAGRLLYDEAAESLRNNKAGLKYPTATIAESPNAVLRKLLRFSVIHRPISTIPGIRTNFTGNINLDIVRVATGGTYDDPGQMIGDYAAASLRIVDRKTVEQAARYAFSIAARDRKSLTSSSKYTIQRVTDGLFEDIVEEISKEFLFAGQVEHRRELFDALLAKLVMNPENFRVVLVLNEYGDFLSDLAGGLVGSMGLGASASLSFDEKGHVSAAMFDAAHGTAPDIVGQDKANPTAIFRALAMLLQHIGESRDARALLDGLYECLDAGETTGDLGGSHGTKSFTQAVAARVKAYLAD